MTDYFLKDHQPLGYGMRSPPARAVADYFFKDHLLASASMSVPEHPAFKPHARG
jgi:hypothetical protein